MSSFMDENPIKERNIYPFQTDEVEFDMDMNLARRKKRSLHLFGYILILKLDEEEEDGMYLLHAFFPRYG